MTTSILTVPKGSNIAKAIVTTKSPLRKVQMSSRKPDRIHEKLKQSLPLEAQQRLLQPKAADVTKPDTLAAAFQDADIVVSLVGILHGTPSDFERIQWRGAENVAQAAQEAGAKLIHFSAIGADPNSEIPYERTKGLGEKAVREACPSATIIRPSLVFGPEDDFLNVRPAFEIRQQWHEVLTFTCRDLLSYHKFFLSCRSSGEAQHVSSQCMWGILPKW